MRPLPPIDSFEVFEADPLVDQLILGDVAIFLEASCHTASFKGGTAPRIGCHSVIDKPDPVRRVAPPTTTMARRSRPRPKAISSRPEFLHLEQRYGVVQMRQRWRVKIILEAHHRYHRLAPTDKKSKRAPRPKPPDPAHPAF